MKTALVQIVKSILHCLYCLLLLFIYSEIPPKKVLPSGKYATCSKRAKTKSAVFITETAVFFKVNTNIEAASEQLLLGTSDELLSVTSEEFQAKAKMLHLAFIITRTTSLHKSNPCG